MHVIIRSKYYSSVDICRFLQTSGQELPLFYCCALVVKGTPHRWPATLGIVGILFSKAIPHNSKCRYGERGTADAKSKAQIILDAAKVSAASGGCSEPKQGQRSQSARGFCPRSTMQVPQPDIIEHFGNADAVPQPPERCLSRQAEIVRCCLNKKGTAPGEEPGAVPFYWGYLQGESEEEEITKPRPAQTVSDARGGVLYYWFSGSAADRTNYLYRSTSLVRWV